MVYGMSDSEEDSVSSSLKIVLVGDPNAGKTSFVRRFCYDDFTRQYNATIGADFYAKRVTFGEKREVSLKISDVGGLEVKGTMLDKYLHNTDMIVLFYDITDATTFENLNVWIDAIANLIESPPFTAVVGCKCDLEHQRAVRLDKTKAFVKETGLYNFLISAKTGENVHTSMTEIVAKFLGIPLTKLQKEQQQSVIRAELVPSNTNFPQRNKTNKMQSQQRTTKRSNNNCSLQ